MTAAHPYDAQIRALYAEFLDSWNRRSGAAVAAGFADDGDIIGIDGAQHSGRLTIASDLRRVFATNRTAGYIGLIRSVRPIADGVAVLYAHAGALPPDATDVDPSLLAVHTLVAVDEGGGRWKISVFQSTSAAWPADARRALAEELRGALTPQ